MAVGDVVLLLVSLSLLCRWRRQHSHHQLLVSQ